MTVGKHEQGIVLLSAHCTRRGNATGTGWLSPARSSAWPASVQNLLIS